MTRASASCCTRSGTREPGRAGWKRMCLRQGLFRRREALRLRLANDYTFGALFLTRDSA